MTRATLIQGQNLSEQTPGFGTTKTRRAASRASLVLALCAILLAPIWTVHYPPLVDYPNHLASAFVLAHLKDPAFHFSQFYASDWNTYPYLAMDLILVGLQWFFPIDVAGRLFLSLCVLVVPLAVWFFIREANPGQDTLALWSLFISTGVYFFLDGLLNLQLGLALCFLVLGLWLRWLDRPRLTLWCLLLVATTALYFTHLVGFGVACFVATAYSILAHRRIREILLTWILFLAGILFYLHLVVHVRIGWTWGSHDFARKATGLLVVMLGYSPALDFLTLVVMVGCIILGRSGNPEFRWNHRWLGVAGCLFVLYWIFPGAYGAAMEADRRLVPFLFILTLAAVRFGRRARLLGSIALLLFVLHTGDVEHHFLSLQPRLAEMSQSFSAIPNGARVLPMSEWTKGVLRPERHFWAYGVIQRGWFSPCLFHDPGVHPFKIKLQTSSPCGPGIFGPESFDWARVQHDFDYVWAYDVPQLYPSLSAIGKLAFENGDVRVFRLTKPSAGVALRGNRATARRYEAYETGVGRHSKQTEPGADCFLSWFSAERRGERPTRALPVGEAIGQSNREGCHYHAAQ